MINNQSLKAIAVIPARLASSRLPNKVLADIGGKPMLWHVYQRCLQAFKISEVHVATDAQVVAEMVESWGGNVWMTSPHCASGTERIVSILEQLSGDLIVNVQGDQPFIEPMLIDQLVETFEQLYPPPDIVTAACQITDATLFDSNLVKLTRRHDGYVLYFSRSPIPYIRDVAMEDWPQAATFWGHLGVYAYDRQVLEEYSTFSESDLETVEKLEQLRFLQAGKSIYALITTHPPLSVDTPKDLERIRQLVGKGK
jgi:3-deoxy-manno-octulosonate cytidylyltransferase (CMP-KDO synthetase)